MDSSPLVDAHLQAINQALRNISDYRALAAKVKAAGGNTDVHDAAADQMEAQLTGYKREFFGPSPTTKKRGE